MQPEPLYSELAYDLIDSYPDQLCDIITTIFGNLSATERVWLLEQLPAIHTQLGAN